MFKQRTHSMFNTVRRVWREIKPWKGCCEPRCCSDSRWVGYYVTVCNKCVLWPVSAWLFTKFCSFTHLKCSYNERRNQVLSFASSLSKMTAQASVRPGWCRKLGASSGPPKWIAGVKILRSFSAVFPRRLGWRWMGWGWQGSVRQCHRWQYNPPCHNVGPSSPRVWVLVVFLILDSC